MSKFLAISSKCIFGCSLATIGFLLPIAAYSHASEIVIHAFKGSREGLHPEAGVLMDTSGNLYGTTPDNVVRCRDLQRLPCGTVFKVAPDGTETVLHRFDPFSGDGAFPAAGLVMDSTGNLYGTTEAGGKDDVGTVFKISPKGHETILYSFTGGTENAAEPEAGLVMDSSGNLYGTTVSGGARNCSEGIPCGTVFKISTSHVLTILYDFQAGQDGALPYAALTEDTAGNFYGTTLSGGGTGCGGYGCGTVFKLAPNGIETVLYRFTGGSDGGSPYAGVILDGSGNLYGTTFYGGTGCSGCGGVVYKLGTDGTETVLYSFCSANECKDGRSPTGTLIADSAGNLFGTTVRGGAAGCSKQRCGTVFKLATDGRLSVLYRFSGGSDGGSPYAGVILDGSGNLYGTTLFGGSGHRGRGTVFEIKQ